MPEFVEYRGRRVVEGWTERIAEAQRVTEYVIGGSAVPRIRYGDETEDWGADTVPCHDCAVVKGEFHVPGCDAEECPVCHGQAMTCECQDEGEEEDQS